MPPQSKSVSSKSCLPSTQWSTHVPLVPAAVLVEHPSPVTQSVFCAQLKPVVTRHELGIVPTSRASPVLQVPTDTEHGVPVASRHVPVVPSHTSPVLHAVGLLPHGVVVAKRHVIVVLSQTSPVLQFPVWFKHESPVVKRQVWVVPSHTSPVMQLAT